MMDSSASSSAPAPPPEPTPWWWRAGLLLAVAAVALAAYAGREYISLQAQSALGFCCLLGLAASFSTNLRAVNWRTIVCGLILQVLLAVLVLKVEIAGVRPGQVLFESIGNAFYQLLQFSNQAALLVFGPLADDAEVQRVFPRNLPLLALDVVAPVILISSLFSVLYYYGVLQLVVRALGTVMMYLMRTSGAETLSAVANVFMGQTEAPLIIKPYVAGMTRSELLAMMVGGMATISGGMMVVYISLGADRVALLAASVMAAPCGLYLAKLILPETQRPATSGMARTTADEGHANAIDALAAGAASGMMLAINVIAMLIAFLGLLALVDYLLGELATGQSLWQTMQEADSGLRLLNVVLLVLVFYLLCRWLNRGFIHFGNQRPLHRMFGMESRPRRLANYIFVLVLFALFVFGMDQLLLALPQDLQLKTIFGTIFSPLAFLMGVPLADVWTVGDLLGIKLAANEFLAFDELTRTYRDAIQERSFILTTYALTGFANFGSVGIQIGGIGALAPARRSDLARLGLPAMLIGFLATVMNAALVGVFL